MTALEAMSACPQCHAPGLQVRNWGGGDVYFDHTGKNPHICSKTKSWRKRYESLFLTAERLKVLLDKQAELISQMADALNGRDRLIDELVAHEGAEGFSEDLNKKLSIWAGDETEKKDDIDG